MLFTEKVTVCRFSDTGFDLVEQTYLKQDTEYLLSKAHLEVPAHLRTAILQIQKDVPENWESQCVGFWVFVGKSNQQDPEFVRFQLNHLTAEQKAQKQWFEMDLAKDTWCYPAHRALRGKPVQLKDLQMGDAAFVFKQP